MIVVDANIVAYLLLGGEFSDLPEARPHTDAEWTRLLTMAKRIPENILARYLQRKLLGSRHSGCDSRPDGRS